MALDWAQEAISVIVMQREDTDKTSVRNMAYYRPYQEKASVQILKILFRKADNIAVSINATMISCSELWQNFFIIKSLFENLF